MIKNEDIKYMQRAIIISTQGYGKVNPNPIVGAVIVNNGEIIGEGYHKYFGGNHAEIDAINNATQNINGSTLYVTLEPCSHHGKTPPCIDAIIKEGFERVVIGMKDPNPLVNGKGIEKLKNAGIEVETDVLNNEVMETNEVFIKYIKTKKAYVAIKTAMTMDGKIATHTGHSKWISGKQSREFVHKLRHKYSAIMVGVNTVIADNPELTDRSSYTNKCHPIRIIVDTTGKTPLLSKILNTKIAKTIIATTAKADSRFVEAMQNIDVKVLVCEEKNGKVNLCDLVDRLSKQGIDSILLEGGSKLNFSAINEGIVDKIYSFIAPKLIGGEKAKSPIGGKGFDTLDKAIMLDFKKIKRFGQDVLIEAYIKKS